MATTGITQTKSTRALAPARGLDREAAIRTRRREDGFADAAPDAAAHACVKLAGATRENGG